MEPQYQDQVVERLPQYVIPEYVQSLINSLDEESKTYRYDLSILIGQLYNDLRWKNNGVDKELEALAFQLLKLCFWLDKKGASMCGIDVERIEASAPFLTRDDLRSLPMTLNEVIEISESNTWLSDDANAVIRSLVSTVGSILEKE